MICEIIQLPSAWHPTCTAPTIMCTINLYIYNIYTCIYIIFIYLYINIFMYSYIYIIFKWSRPCRYCSCFVCRWQLALSEKWTILYPCDCTQRYPCYLYRTLFILWETVSMSKQTDGFRTWPFNFSYNSRSLYIAFKNISKMYHILLYECWDKFHFLHEKVYSYTLPIMEYL